MHSLANSNINNQYTITMRNNFDTLKETSENTPNDEYENFVMVHIEAATECITTKPKVKRRFLRESITRKNKITWK